LVHLFFPPGFFPEVRPCFGACSEINVSVSRWYFFLTISSHGAAKYGRYFFLLPPFFPVSVSVSFFMAATPPSFSPERRVFLLVSAEEPPESVGRPYCRKTFLIVSAFFLFLNPPFMSWPHLHFPADAGVCRTT